MQLSKLFGLLHTWFTVSTYLAELFRNMLHTVDVLQFVYAQPSCIEQGSMSYGMKPTLPCCPPVFRSTRHHTKVVLHASLLEHLQDLEPSHKENVFCRKLCFSSDFKRHIEAADLLLQQLPDVTDAAVSCLDLLLRWAVLRLCDANTQCLLKVLELCKALFAICQEMVSNRVLRLMHYHVKVFHLTCCDHFTV